MGSKITRALRANQPPRSQAARADPTLVRSAIRCMSIGLAILVLFALGFISPFQNSGQSVLTYALLSTVCLISMNSLNPIKMLMISNMLLIIYTVLIPWNCLLYQLLTLCFLHSFSSLACNYLLISDGSALLCSTIAYVYISIIRVAEKCSSSLISGIENDSTALKAQEHHRLSIRLTFLFMTFLCSLLIVSAHVHIVRYKTTRITIAQQLKLVLNQKLSILLLGIAYCGLQCLFVGGNSSLLWSPSRPLMSTKNSMPIYSELIIIFLSLCLGSKLSSLYNQLCYQYETKKIVRLSCMHVVLLLFALSETLCYFDVFKHIKAVSSILFHIYNFLMHICVDSSLIVLSSLIIRVFMPRQRVNMACIYIVICHKIAVSLWVNRAQNVTIWAVVFCISAVHQASSWGYYMGHSQRKPEKCIGVNLEQCEQIA